MRFFWKCRGRLFVSEHAFDPLFEFFVFGRVVDGPPKGLGLIFAGKFFAGFGDDAGYGGVTAGEGNLFEECIGLRRQACIDFDPFVFYSRQTPFSHSG